MKAMIVDDEMIAIETLKLTLAEFQEITEVTSFRFPIKALEWLKEHTIEVAFLDINMKQMNGLSLAEKIKERCPNCFIVFVTGHSEYAIQAFRLHATGYLLKPVCKDDIQKELDYIRKTIANIRGINAKIRVQCFGNFEVFVEEEPMRFQYTKTKELLAYLIDRKGAFSTNSEIMNILWEGRASSRVLSSQLRNLLADLISAFKTANATDVIRKRRGMIAVAPEKLQCDFYDWMQTNQNTHNAYIGEYMSQYSWGEVTLGMLSLTWGK